MFMQNFQTKENMLICNCQINCKLFFIQLRIKASHNDREILLHSKIMMKKDKIGLIETGATF
jgi:hypothetical protein